jgi:protein-disulfide isomerase
MSFSTFASALLLSLTAVMSSSCQKNETSTGAEKDKSVPDVNLPGIDTGSLTAREKREWSGYVARLPAHCAGQKVSVAACVEQKLACNLCVPEAKFILKTVRDGYTEEQVEKAFAARFDPDKVKAVPEDESPTKGPANAPITVVEFADFECPFCGSEFAVMKKAFETHSPNVRFIYKIIALPMHQNAEPAARAAFAAMKQGKFWEMHDKLFQNQQAQQRSDLEAYAKDLGLDIPKFLTDMNSSAAKDRIERDKKTFETIGAKGTPTIFVNGRDFDPKMDINDWITLELQLRGSNPGGAPSLAMPSGATAAASGSPTLMPSATATGATSAVAVKATASAIAPASTLSSIKPIPIPTARKP